MNFIFKQFIPEPAEIVFGFFRNPACLPLLHSQEKHLRVLRHTGDGQVGDETWAEITMFNILPVVLGFYHNTFNPPHGFSEFLTHGLFEAFTHVHEFRDCDGGTQIIDRIEIRLPWFYGGEPAVRCLAEPILRRSFEIRHRALRHLVETGQFKRQALENLQLAEAL
jgi:ligand-binding SRPBCC domain-containing protein